MEKDGNGSKDVIPIITKERYCKIKVDEIEFIEQIESMLHIMTIEHQEYIFRGKIEDIVPIISGKSFYRVMKKLVVNFDNVQNMGKSTMNFVSGITYGIGRNNFLKARRAYKNYLYGYPPFLGREERRGSNVAETFEYQGGRRIWRRNKIKLKKCLLFGCSSSIIKKLSGKIFMREALKV